MMPIWENSPGSTTSTRLVPIASGWPGQSSACAVPEKTNTPAAAMAAPKAIAKVDLGYARNPSMHQPKTGPHAAPGTPFRFGHYGIQNKRDINGTKRDGRNWVGSSFQAA